MLSASLNKTFPSFPHLHVSSMFKMVELEEGITVNSKNCSKNCLKEYLLLLNNIPVSVYADSRSWICWSRWRWKKTHALCASTTKPTPSSSHALTGRCLVLYSLVISIYFHDCIHSVSLGFFPDKKVSDTNIEICWMFSVLLIFKKYIYLLKNIYFNLFI